MYVYMQKSIEESLIDIQQKTLTCLETDFLKAKCNNFTSKALCLEFDFAFLNNNFRNNFVMSVPRKIIHMFKIYE